MKTDNELLLHIYKSSDMGVKSLKKILNILLKKENKIKKEISFELKGYEDIYKDSKKLMEKENIKKIGTNIITSLAANVSITNEIETDNSDTKVADILIRGYTMGILETEKRIEDYEKIANRKTISLANKLLKFQKDSVENLKAYL